jgi:uncharacterized membrane protein SpoIIM required for sporulation
MDRRLVALAAARPPLARSLSAARPYLAAAVALFCLGAALGWFVYGPATVALGAGAGSSVTATVDGRLADGEGRLANASVEGRLVGDRLTADVSGPVRGLEDGRLDGRLRGATVSGTVDGRSFAGPLREGRVEGRVEDGRLTGRVEGRVPAAEAEPPSTLAFAVNNVGVALFLLSGTVLFGATAVAGVVYNGMVMAGTVRGGLATGLDPGSVGALLAPHGVVELPGLLLAAAVGLMVPWKVLAYLARRRETVLTRGELADAVQLAALSVALILVAAWVEATVTPALV